MIKSDSQQEELSMVDPKLYEEWKESMEKQKKAIEDGERMGRPLNTIMKELGIKLD